MIRAIVLAAGASSRMGQAKAALPLGTTGDTVVARVVATLLAAGLPSVAVVAGAHIDAVRAAMPRFEPRARVVEHLGWAQGQLSSLLAAGPRVLKQHRGNGGNGVWKVELVRDSSSPADATVEGLHALRGSGSQAMPRG